AVRTDQKAANRTEAAGRIHHRSTYDGEVERRRGARGQNGIGSGRRAAVVHNDLSVHVNGALGINRPGRAIIGPGPATGGNDAGEDVGRGVVHCNPASSSSSSDRQVAGAATGRDDSFPKQTSHGQTEAAARAASTALAEAGLAVRRDPAVQ